MDEQIVEIADRYSRKRVLIVVLAALAFLLIQFVAGPRVFVDAPTTAIDWWAINALALLAVLATGGGLLNKKGVRVLVHDELARNHLQAAVASGYWTAMALGFLLYFVPSFADLAARQVIYLIVTGSIVVPLLVFALLEHRAHRDG